MAITNVHIKNGYIYQDGKAKEFKNLNGTEMKIQAVGTGTYKVVGILGNGIPKKLTMVDMTAFDIVDVCKDDTVFCTDISGLTSITVESVDSGIESIYVDIYVK